MTVKDITTLKTDVNTALADNTNGEISPLDVRSSVIDTIDSLNDVFVSGSSSNKKAILVAGQSNTLWARDFGEAPTVTGALDLGIKSLGRHDQHNLVVLNSGVTNIHYQDQDGVRTGYAYPLAKQIKDELSLDEILIIPVAVGGTGWSNNRWTADGDLFQDVMARVRYVVGTLGYDLAGAFWSQGETDSNATVSPYYQHLLHGLISSVRTVARNAGQSDANTIPFVTFDMVTAWVGSDVNRLNVQNALSNLPSVMPYTGNADTTNLPADTETDVIHYDARQMMELGNRMFAAWQSARANTTPSPFASAGEYTVYRALHNNLITNCWNGLQFGNSAADNLYSRFGELWKYENDGKYRFKAQWFVSGVLNEIVFEQELIPHFATQRLSAASLISFSPSNTRFGEDNQMGFTGITYRGNGDGTGNALCTLNSGINWYFPFGQLQPFTGGIPISKINGVVDLASEVVLKAIKL